MTSRTEIGPIRPSAADVVRDIVTSLEADDYNVETEWGEDGITLIITKPSVTQPPTVDPLGTRRDPLDGLDDKPDINNRLGDLSTRDSGSTYTLDIVVDQPYLGADSDTETEVTVSGPQ